MIYIEIVVLQAEVSERNMCLLGVVVFVLHCVGKNCGAFKLIPSMVVSSDRSAARDGNLECVRLLIAGKATVDASEVLGRTPLMQVAHGGNLRTVQLLLASSARCDRVAGDGKTAMDLGTSRADVNMVRLLARPSVRHLEEVLTADDNRLPTVFPLWF